MSSAQPSPAIDTQFERCVEVITHPPAGVKYRPTVEERLLFYALYKQVTVGNCREPKPSVFNVVASKKWEAWKALHGRECDDAKREYVKAVVNIAQRLSVQGDTAFLKAIQDNDAVVVGGSPGGKSTKVTTDMPSRTSSAQQRPCAAPRSVIPTSSTTTTAAVMQVQGSLRVVRPLLWLLLLEKVPHRYVTVDDANTSVQVDVPLASGEMRTLKTHSSVNGVAPHMTYVAQALQAGTLRRNTGASAFSPSWLGESSDDVFRHNVLLEWIHLRLAAPLCSKRARTANGAPLKSIPSEVNGLLSEHTRPWAASNSVTISDLLLRCLLEDYRTHHNVTHTQWRREMEAHEALLFWCDLCRSELPQHDQVVYMDCRRPPAALVQPAQSKI